MAGATLAVIVRRVRVGASTIVDPYPVGVTVGEDEVDEHEHEDGQGVEDEERQRRAVQGQTQGNLGDAEESNGTTLPLVQLTGSARQATRVLVQSHHGRERYPSPAPTLLLPSMYPRATDCLAEDEHVDGEADAMMWVGQVSIGADGDEAEDDDDRGQGEGDDVQPDVQPDSPIGSAIVESGEQYSRRNDDQEGDGGDYTVAADQGMILGEPCEPVPHACETEVSKVRCRICVLTIILRRGQVDAHEVWEEEGVSAGVPGSITDIQRAGGVGATPCRRQLRCHLLGTCRGSECVWGSWAISVNRRSSCNKSQVVSLDRPLGGCRPVTQVMSRMKR